MKQLLILIFLFLIQNIFAQLFRCNLKEKKTEENILVEKISEDELHSTYLITIKNNVPLHLHKSHSENIVVIDGEAIMKIGDDTLKILPKDQITIPKGTIHEVIRVIGKRSLKVISVQSPKFDPSDRYFIKN